MNRRSWALVVWSFCAYACGGGSSTYRVSSAATVERPAYQTEATSGSAGAEGSIRLAVLSEDSGGSDHSDEEDRYEPSGGEAAPAPPPPPAPAPPGRNAFGVPAEPVDIPQIAQVDARHRPPNTVPPAANPAQAAQTPQTATDATSGPLLIYQAILHMAVYQVQDNQRAVVTIAREMDGFLAQQSDTIVVIRVPARRFNEALSRIEALGDVLHRNIQATDVSEEFRDTTIRLRNLEQVRDRLAALLAQARTVEESLQIERELERLTTEIESMKGRLRFLEDRIAFSTITVNFSPREQETLQGELFNLPFDFLYSMGLRTLLNLR